MATKITSITCQVKRGKQTVFERQNPVLASGEPVVVWCNDGTTRLKFGNGAATYKELPFIGEESIVNKPTHFQFPNVGESNIIYKAEREAKLYQWNSETLRYEALGTASTDNYSSGVVFASTADYAEIAEWSDSNIYEEERIGYFVCVDIKSSRPTVRKASTIDDVRGITVKQPGFTANASAEKFNENNELLPKYCYIGLMGIVDIIDYGRCKVGEKCMPADDGTAMPSYSNFGYQVINRVDDTHITVIVEPNADAVYHIYKDMTESREELVKYIDDKVSANGGIFNAKFKSEFPLIGEPNILYKAEKESLIYQWNTTNLEYEALGSSAAINNIEYISGGLAENLILV